ncbi:hypothetical protein KKB17_00270 [bacterium]|nr:hypothetical protein [Candidatus Atribacteria bacterium]MBU4047701.1 hypothetical protein [bacterium]MBU4561828.1 hypothetical protein [bacterium]
MKLRLEVYILTILVFLFSINIASAITVDEIMDKMEETAPDFTTQKTISEMILIDQEGNEEIREMIMFSQEGENGKSSTLVRFLSPKSVKGVTLLILMMEKKYIYICLPMINQGESPVLRRVMNLWEQAFLMKI